MTNIASTARRIAIPLALLAATVSATAHAEYKCAKPGLLTVPEQRACELARQDTPDAFVRYVKTRGPMYGLYVNDYYNEADEKRWDLAKQNQAAHRSGVANAQTGTKTADRAN